MKKKLKIIVWIIGIGIITCLSLLLICNQIVVSNAKGKVFSELDSIVPTEYGLLLGTTPQTRIGHRQNMFFKYRIDAAEQLHKAGKVEKHFWTMAYPMPSILTWAPDGITHGIGTKGIS